MSHIPVRLILLVFWKHTIQYPTAALVIFFSSLIPEVVHLITPLYYKKFFDTIAGAKLITETLVSQLLTIIFIIVGFTVLDWSARRIQGLTSIYFQTRVMRDLKQTAFKYLMQQSYRFFIEHFTGSLVRRVNRLSQAFEAIQDEIEFRLFPLCITSIGILVVLSGRHILLGLVLFGWVILFLSLNYSIAKWKLKYDLKKAEQDSITTGVLSDALTNTINIKLFSNIRHERSLYQKATEELRRLRSITWGINETMDGIQGILMISIELALLYSAIKLWQKGILTVGDFILIQMYLGVLFSRLWEFGRIVRRIYEGLADASEMVEVIYTAPEIKDSPYAKTLVVPEGKIEFRNLSFGFENTSVSLLRSFNLRIRPKEKVALVGPSGVGKTTVIKLLLRFYDINEGEVLIDGQNIVGVTQDSLRKNIALVPQEPILFHRTLKENICYGRLDATDEEIISAATKAHCHEFIQNLPLGYETYVGERGVKLSGGEKQRVAIARAILANTPILVLDEATSSLDSESESLIQEALHELMREKTTIVIAHRLSTIRQMDRIILMEGGRIVTEGTHEELLRSEGTYKKLWEIQAGGFEISE